MILTAYANLQNALNAINSGYVFRLLIKPCHEQDLQQALLDAIAQHHLIQNQYELEALQKLKMALDGIVTSLVALVEARDPYTAGHQKKVTNLALAIADIMELEDENKESLRLGSMVHDIGKVYVPAQFLNKPSKLTEAEMTIIKTHPVVGFDILKHVAFPWPVSKIVLQHHERLDGSGYPNGLVKNEILPEAQILTVADVVDAMTSLRPYRAGMGIDSALAEIQKHAGIQYDRDIVRACVCLFREKGYILK
jgi:putative nucleotidyltransferase with HDIG domain